MRRSIPTGGEMDALMDALVIWMKEEIEERTTNEEGFQSGLTTYCQQARKEASDALAAFVESRGGRMSDLPALHRAEIVRLEGERDAALALAERRAGERDRLRDWLNIAKQFVWDEEIVENIDAELAAAPPETAKEPSA